MHRLSLANSPSRNSPIHGGNAEKTLESQREEDKEIQEAKREKLRTGICRNERLVHLIPFVLLFCILVLYLFSFDPLGKENSKIEGLERFLDRGVGELLALYSHRSMQQAERKGATTTATPFPPLHRYRKLADF